MNEVCEIKISGAVLGAEPKKVIGALLNYLCSESEQREGEFLQQAFGEETAVEIAEKFADEKGAKRFAKALKRLIGRCVRAERKRQIEAAKGYLR